ncbi:hypothetical protein WJX72_001988 [[Myrmecia] bisecta]|uniref:S1-like domain-containing protein n=1 Tax=[Myrmecia] bisecta TaxID=41462 RepID=A0AAW1Q0G9_9CHLO
MSIRRKHVTQGSLQNEVQPPGPGQRIVRAVGSRGGNIVEVEYPDGHKTLSLLPARFNKKLWVKRGGYLIIQEGASDGGRVTAEIVNVLYDKDVKEFKRQPGVWPADFANLESDTATTDMAAVATLDCLRDAAADASCSDPESDDGLPPLHENNNRQVTEFYITDDDSDAEDAATATPSSNSSRHAEQAQLNQQKPQADIT